MKLEVLRHSISHVMAYAIKDLAKNKVKFGIGPAIENGFYYDFDLKNPLSQKDFGNIEKKMREIIKKDLAFKKKTISKTNAKKLFKDQPYKLELIEKLPGEKVSVYETGEFADLCQGPHLKSTKDIPLDSFKLTRVAGAYWLGSEKNQMLTRIYGTAFSNKKDLNKHLQKETEAEKRDHRVLGQKLDLFHFDEAVGPGLVLWHPKGALLKKTIMDYALREYLDNGYLLVDTPHVAKLGLWKTSGHTDFYKENMYPPMRMQELDKEEKDDYQIKPMNCPLHIAIYKDDIKSYKDLPIRYTEMGTVYRYERSGTLHGLIRVRGLTQDDAHIFCTPDQLSEELFSALKLTQGLLKSFGFKELNFYLSTKPKKYVGAPKLWQKAENSLKYALDKLKMKYEVDEGGGAFYGPKIDIKIKDALDREWQCTTIQVDFNLPERFNISYIDKSSKKQRPIIIHRALLGALERFVGILLEYYGGELPVWLSPVQVSVIPVGERHEKYATQIGKELIEAGLRAEVKNRSDTVSKKIRDGEMQKIPYLLVVGDKEIKSKSVAVRERKKGDTEQMKLTKFLEIINKVVEKKK